MSTETIECLECFEEITLEMEDNSLVQTVKCHSCETLLYVNYQVDPDLNLCGPVEVFYQGD